jgi:myo-inositol-1(or 4)-monophosphatase
MKDPVLAEIEELARKAGAIVREGYDRQHTISYKGVIDLVTEVDHASEDLLLGEIRQRWPDSTILSEESGLTNGSTQRSWYVDPLDGTVNYAHGIPIFSVSIAYADSGRVKLGAVYDPMRDEMFSAERGAGAQLNGQPIRVSAVTAARSVGHRFSIRRVGHQARQLRQLCANEQADSGCAPIGLGGDRRRLGRRGPV